jgi:hypothetical protein
MVVSAMVEFQEGFTELEKADIPPEWNGEIENYYTKEFLPRGVTISLFSS